MSTRSTKAYRSSSASVQSHPRHFSSSSRSGWCKLGPLHVLFLILFLYSYMLFLAVKHGLISTCTMVGMGCGDDSGIDTNTHAHVAKGSHSLLIVEEGRRKRRRATRAAHLKTEREIEEEENAVAIPAVEPAAAAAALSPPEARSKALSRPTTHAVKPSRYAGQKLLYMVRIPLVPLPPSLQQVVNSLGILKRNILDFRC